MTVILMIIIAVMFLSFSIFKSRQKTVAGIKIAKTMMINTFIEVAGIMSIVGIVLALLPPEVIRNLLGNTSTTLSAIFGAAIGTVTIMPAVIAFPLSETLYTSGAHLVAIAAFVTTLTMVGLVTLPIEIRHFGKRFSLIRNSVSFLAALLIAFTMGIFI